MTGTRTAYPSAPQHLCRAKGTGGLSPGPSGAHPRQDPAQGVEQRRYRSREHRRSEPPGSAAQRRGSTRQAARGARNPIPTGPRCSPTVGAGPRRTTTVRPGRRPSRQIPACGHSSGPRRRRRPTRWSRWTHASPVPSRPGYRRRRTARSADRGRPDPRCPPSRSAPPGPAAATPDARPLGYRRHGGSRRSSGRPVGRVGHATNAIRQPQPAGSLPPPRPSHTGGRRLRPRPTPHRPARTAAPPRAHHG